MGGGSEGMVFFFSFSFFFTILDSVISVPLPYQGIVTDICAMQYFTSEQLEDLEGVLWKSYFA